MKLSARAPAGGFKTTTYCVKSTNRETSGSLPNFSRIPYPIENRKHKRIAEHAGAFGITPAIGPIE